MILAIDYGKKRCGYAYGEISPAKIGVKSPKETVQLVKDLKPDVIVVGLPLSMSGRYSCQTFEVMKFVEKLLKYDSNIKLVDERLSTKMAHEMLKMTRNNTPVDAVSASILLDTFVRNPNASYSVPKKLAKIKPVKITGENVLVFNVPNPNVLNLIQAEEIKVFQEDPYIAYLFKKNVEFVERDLNMLDEEYDVIVTCEDIPENVKAKKVIHLTCLW
jgi:putative Holliday junction resolvase